jgi:hypothetical protein
LLAKHDQTLKSKLKPVAIELDRGTEASRVLRKKAEGYARALPHSSLRDLRPVVILAVPSDRRAQTATAAVAGTGAPIAVVVWSATSCAPVLPIAERASAG